MACHTAFEVDFYRQTAVVFSHSLGRMRTLKYGRKGTASGCFDLPQDFGFQLSLHSV
jgi:hypothetical protein